MTDSNLPPVTVLVAYYSATGHVHALAHAVAEGAREAGAEVRVRHVEELAPDGVVGASLRLRGVEHAPFSESAYAV